MRRFFLVAVVAALISPIQAADRDEKKEPRGEEPKRPWTILLYGAVDNDSDDSFVAFTDKLRRAIDDDPGIELVLFIDRWSKHKKRATFLGDDFTGTRLYRVKKGSVERLSGGKYFPEITKAKDVNLNSADASTLQRFIAWGKANYPARRYGLLNYSHANGKSMCPDDRAGSEMGIAEVTDKIGVNERVDFLALELCNMGGLEIAYQWRPGNGRFEADILLAIPNAGPPLDWDRAFGRVRSPGHAPKGGAALDPAKMTAADFGKLVIEEGRLGREASEKKSRRASKESAGCYDLRQAEAVKKAVDALAVELTKSESKGVFLELRSASSEGRLISYTSDGSYVDLYDLCRRLAGCDRLPVAVRSAAADVMKNVQGFTIASFGMSGYKQFEPGKNGVFIVLPSGRPNSWKDYSWYTPIKGDRENYGNWSFLKDGATPGNGVVENWYELLESWFNVRESRSTGNAFVVLPSFLSVDASAEEFTDAIRAYLDYRTKTETGDVGIVGLVDEHGSRIISFGKLANDADKPVDGDTVFGMYSQTCIYTGLLLQDMVERGEMKLDDPVAKYLPESVKMPTYHGKEITIRHLLTETAGLPRITDKFEPKRADNPCADSTIEKMYTLLSGCQLGRPPGAQFVHGGLDVPLLGHVIALKAGTDYETLVVERICNPLGMDSTRFTLTPNLKSRLVTRYRRSGYEAAYLEWGVEKPLAGLHSTANDLLKFLSANLGFTKSSVSPLLEKHVWGGYELEGGVVHIGGGGTAGGSVYSGFDRKRRRGVVFLTASGTGRANARSIGKFLLECEWRPDRRPSEIKLASDVYGSYAGQYQRSPDFAFGLFATRQFLRSTRYIPAAICLLVLMLVVWRVRGARKRWLILGCAVLGGALLAPLVVLLSGHIFCYRFQPRIGIRAEGNRLFAETPRSELWPIDDWYIAQATGIASQPIDVLWPPIPVELLAVSETEFFERLSTAPVTFLRNNRGKATGLTLHYRGKAYSYEKISDEPPKAPEIPKPHVAISLDTKLLDICVGQYEFPPDALSPSGLKLTIWREGDKLLGKVKGDNVVKGAFDLFPESETVFFLKITGSIFTFMKNDQGQVTGVTHHLEGYPTIEGKKLKGDSSR